MVLSEKVENHIHDFLNNKNRRKKIKDGLSFLPHLFTLGNVFFGFCSLVFVAKGKLAPAAYLILFGALMDVLDGRIARFVGSESDFGVQLDSLADAISFCLAPAFLVYFWQLRRLGLVGIVISFLFLGFGLMRLARFNVIHQEQKDFFLGLPTTIAGCFTAIIFLNFKGAVDSVWFLGTIVILVLSLSFLMISHVRFLTFKQRLFHLKRNWYVVLFILLFAILSVLQFEKVLLMFFLLYFSSAIFVKVILNLRR
ncbi:CDP-diacylglycerol--serine O-phosphatidyltransferase [Candidatus Babeliales bacterium]|nr:CDP-diacylglycerol--serine O-phosphatidyltransferase [Candidatus Babeliales bacterium]